MGIQIQNLQIVTYSHAIKILHDCKTAFLKKIIIKQKLVENLLIITVYVRLVDKQTLKVTKGNYKTI